MYLGYEKKTLHLQSLSLAYFSIFFSAFLFCRTTATAFISGGNCLCPLCRILYPFLFIMTSCFVVNCSSLYWKYGITIIASINRMLFPSVSTFYAIKRCPTSAYHFFCILIFIPSCGILYPLIFVVSGCFMVDIFRLGYPGMRMLRLAAIGRTGVICFCLCLLRAGTAGRLTGGRFCFFLFGCSRSGCSTGFLGIIFFFCLFFFFLPLL